MEKGEREEARKERERRKRREKKKNERKREWKKERVSEERKDKGKRHQIDTCTCTHILMQAHSELISTNYNCHGHYMSAIGIGLPYYFSGTL